LGRRAVATMMLRIATMPSASSATSASSVSQRNQP
jgi:hypothetical protein